MNILCCSYGKDSLACIGACEKLGWKIDKIVHAELWATDTIPADLPPMVEFKKKADKIIEERYGIKVEHYSSSAPYPKNSNKIGRYRCTYENQFYRTIPEMGKKADYREQCRKEHRKCHNENGIQNIWGFPILLGPWCNSHLKVYALDEIDRQCKAEDKNNMLVKYLGIAADEPKRIKRFIDNPQMKMPLVEIGWTEAQTKQWCIDNDLLSPIYTDKCMRGGCWFCHNQGIDQLRQLRHNYPEYWELLLKWDSDSPVTFHADGHTVHDFDRRFRAEDEGFINAEERFKWIDLDMQQYNILHYFNVDGSFKGFPKENI